MKGWVYILTNQAMPGLVKIGYSDRDPENRAKEIDSTGSAAPYEVSFAALVNSPKKVEKTVHSRLELKHERKEWFRCDVDYAIRMIMDVSSGAQITHGKLPQDKTSNNIEAFVEFLEEFDEQKEIFFIRKLDKPNLMKVVISSKYNDKNIQIANEKDIENNCVEFAVRTLSPIALVSLYGLINEYLGLSNSLPPKYVDNWTDVDGFFEYRFVDVVDALEHSCGGVRVQQTRGLSLFPDNCTDCHQPIQSLENSREAYRYVYSEAYDLPDSGNCNPRARIEKVICTDCRKNYPETHVSSW